MLVVLAPDKFKGSLTAREVADALAEGMRSVRGDLLFRRSPVADGGDGTVSAFIEAGWDLVTLVAPGPLDAEVTTGYAVRGPRAVVELAAVSGLSLLPHGRLDSLGAGTFGLGVVIGHALDGGAREIIIGLGGSASTDGGAGMARALGARITDAAGYQVPRGGGALLRATELDLAGLHPAVSETEFLLACDVENPLLGPTGAAAVYGPQKGASRAEVVALEAALGNWARVVESAVGGSYAQLPGAGAAGGVGFGAMAILGARQQSGIEVVLAATGFADQLAGADLVITGEGSLDAQSLHGKAPTGVVAAARAASVPVIAVAGRTELTESELAAAGFTACHTLAELEPDQSRSMTQAATLLEAIGERIARGL